MWQLLPTICWYRPFLLALAHCGWLLVHYPLVSSIYINLTLCMVLYIIFIDYIICSCMWVTYLPFHQVRFLVPRGTSQHSHRFSASTVKMSALRPPKVAPHSPRMSELSQDLFASSMWFDGRRLAVACACFDTRSGMVSMAMYSN